MELVNSIGDGLSDAASAYVSLHYSLVILVGGVAFFTNSASAAWAGFTVLSGLNAFGQTIITPSDAATIWQCVGFDWLLLVGSMFFGCSENWLAKFAGAAILFVTISNPCILAGFV